MLKWKDLDMKINLRSSSKTILVPIDSEKENLILIKQIMLFIFAFDTKANNFINSWNKSILSKLISFTVQTTLQ